MEQDHKTVYPALILTIDWLQLFEEIHYDCVFSYHVKINPGVLD